MTKTYRMLIQLERLAQFDPSHEDAANDMLGGLLTLDDEETYRRLKFTPEMIRFTEDFCHDAVHHDED